MATTALGYSFAPTFENAELGKRGGAPGDFPQGSLQVLNFRLPSVTGAPGSNALSPLTGDRPTGGFGSAVLQSVLHTVLGPDAAAALTAAMPSAAPTPAGAPSPAATAGSSPDADSALLAQLRRAAQARSAAPPFTSPQGLDFTAPAAPSAPPPPRSPGAPTVHPGGMLPGGGDVPIDNAPTAIVNPVPDDSHDRGPNFSNVDPVFASASGRRAVHFG